MTIANVMTVHDNFINLTLHDLPKTKNYHAKIYPEHSGKQSTESKK